MNIEQGSMLYLDNKNVSPGELIEYIAIYCDIKKSI